MSVLDQEKDTMRLRAWKRRAKGHPTRWRTLRDAIAVLSIAWMSTSQFQMAMRRLWALKNSTSRDILEELEAEKSVVQEKQDEFFKWGATKDGVAFWIRDRKAIPAYIVEAASTSTLVSPSEG